MSQSKKQFSQEELKERLTDEQYRVTQEAATEMPGTGAFLHNKEAGTYACVVCGTELFDSNTKFDSGSGWPSFSDVMANESIETKQDFSHGMQRVEVKCANCGAHLGHLFDDGPTASGNRYCINSAALDFKSHQPQKEGTEDANDA